MTKTTTTKPGYANTYHRDNTVSYWDVYQQAWCRRPALLIRDEVLASMTESERQRVATLAAADLNIPAGR